MSGLATDLPVAYWLLRLCWLAIGLLPSFKLLNRLFSCQLHSLSRLTTGLLAPCNFSPYSHWPASLQLASAPGLVSSLLP